MCVCLCVDLFKCMFQLFCPLFCVQAIGCQPWAQQLMMDTPGFVEWVMDRSVGTGKAAKDCKFELVGALLSSSSTQKIFGAHNYLKLKTYLNEGPYYINAVSSSVTTEGAD